ncbi:MAG: DUF3592 domain-containing protein [Saprospiraceae bacterium]|nr:DUF3592 domain-containing protein [Saprospiraceae bacterium]
MNLFDMLPTYISPSFALIGTYCLILANEKQHEIERVLLNGIRTSGTVIEIRQNPSGGLGEAPVVDFKTQTGSHRHFSTTYTSPCAYRVGQQVQIWYKFNKSNRTAALLDDKPGRLPTILFRWGVVLCLLTYPELIKRLMLLL